MDYEVKNLSGDDLGEDQGSGRPATVSGADDDEQVLNAVDEELDRIKGFSDDSWPSAVEDRVSPRTSQVGISGYR